ncbi:MAG: Flp pilus assembly complex ATPase component TadA [Vicinamibacteria bacterium]|jgi:type IV pilus assembly protein PilB|nr:Flp pilus assembly complex ATPase component TadA [Vicinamibacteria bacterium]
MLSKEGLITAQQLQDALAYQKQNGIKLGRALVTLGFVKDDEITGLLSRQYGVPSINLATFDIDATVLKVLPGETCRKYQVIPISRAGAVLSLAMSDPTNVFAMDDIKFMTGYNVDPVVASEIAIEEAINRFYGSARSLQLRQEGGPPSSGGQRSGGGGGGGGLGKTPSLKEVIDGPALTFDDMASVGLSELDVDAIGEDEGEVETLKTEEDEIDLGALSRSSEAAPVVKLTNLLLIDSLKRGASDIHIEPYEKDFRVRFRIDGILYNIMALPMKLKDPLTSRIKIMSKLDISEKRLPQDGRIKIRLKIEDRSKEMDFRVSCLPTLWGEKIVMRLLDKSKLMLDMTKLGFEPASLEKFKRNIDKPYGIVLVTGPTGSGKTNTLYSALASLNKPDINIMTAEDPVEFNLMGINQVQIRDNIGLNFAAALRSFLRQDPNIILVGEIRDYETAEISTKAALTGHLVLSTLHTNDAPSTVSRMVNMGIEPFIVGTAVNLIQAQRLIRRICAGCKEEVRDVPAKVLLDVGFPSEAVGTFPMFKGRGCSTCNGTGYKGRVGLYEVLEINDAVRELIMMGANSVELRKKAIEEGMITLRMSGLEKIKQGITTIEEVLRETVL